MAKANINIELSSKSLDKAIKQIENYKIKLELAKNEILNKLAEYTLERAKLHLKESILHPDTSTGELENSLKIDIDYINDKAKVYTNLYYAKYVEFGTGVRGIEGNYGDKFGTIPYDSSYTSGQAPHRYMLNALLDLQKNYINIAKKIIDKIQIGG